MLPGCRGRQPLRSYWTWCRLNQLPSILRQRLVLSFLALAELGSAAGGRLPPLRYKPQDLSCFSPLFFIYLLPQFPRQPGRRQGRWFGRPPGAGLGGGGGGGGSGGGGGLFGRPPGPGRIGCGGRCAGTLPGRGGGGGSGSKGGGPLAPTRRQTRSKLSRRRSQSRSMTSLPCDPFYAFSCKAVCVVR